MSGSLSVSVVIPVLNGADNVANTLSALQQQVDAPGQTEIIVVDNGSTDRTRDIVRKFDGVTLLEEPKRGPAAARNRGLRAARGEVIAHLDHDALPSRHWLAELVAPFRDPAVVLAGGRVVGYPPKTGAERFMTYYGLWEPENNVKRPNFPFVPSLNMAVRRDAALQIGGWTEEMRTGEDVDFCYRLLTAFAAEIVYCPPAILFHRHRVTDDELRDQAWHYGEGAAHMYRRFPEAVRWDIGKSVHVIRLLTVRGAKPLFLWVGHLLGMVSAKRLEVARYHRLWTWWWWRGFFSMYRRRVRRARP